MTEQPAAPSWLRGCDEPLGEHYDVGLLDLDGTVYTGDVAIPGAAGAVASARALGLRIGYVTNNSARPPRVVADHLSRLGLPATAADVLTSAQAAAALLAARLPAGSRVLVIGGTGLAEALAEQGLSPVVRADQSPVAVVQGWAPELAWPMLAEGAYALRGGLPWIATNVDLTLPTARGIAPGNGSFVALLAGVVGRTPDEVAGKPYPSLLRQAARRLEARRPLVIGDRLDTDIEGGAASGFPTLLVLTGVCGVADLLAASPQHRPTYVAADLAGLLGSHPAVLPDRDGGWICGAWNAVVDPAGSLQVEKRSGATAGRAGDPLRAACAAAWSAADRGVPVTWSTGLVARLAPR